MSEHKTQCDRCFRLMRPDQLVTEDTFKICKDTKACDDWFDQVCEDDKPLKNNQVLRQKVADLERQLAEANRQIEELEALIWHVRGDECYTDEWIKDRISRAKGVKHAKT